MNKDTVFKKYDKPLKGGVLLPFLIEIRGHKCEQCGNTHWLGQLITLQVHHIDGDKTNNTLENLQLLCPNCHSYTDNFGSKNIKQKISDEDFIKSLQENSSIRQALFALGLSDASGNYKRAKKLIEENNIVKLAPLKNKCLKCGKEISKGSLYCVDCFNLEQRKVKDRPLRNELKYLIRNFPFTQIGKQYNVSDNTVRKWCLADRLPTTKKEIKSYSEEEWNLL